MTAIPAGWAGGAGWALRTSRLVSYGVVAILAALFVVGIAIWAGQRGVSVVATSFPGHWTSGDVTAASDELGIRATWVVTYFTVLELLPAAAGIVAALLVLRGSATWFRCFLAIELALFGTMSGAIPDVFDLLVGGGVGNTVKALQGLAWIALFPFAFLFPDGRFVPHWSRWWLAVAVGYLPYAGILEAVGVPDDSVLQLLPVFALMLSASYAAVHRYRKRADAEQRRQLRGVAAAFVLRIALSLVLVAPPVRELLTDESGSGLSANMVAMLASYLVAAMLPVAVAVAVLRYRLYGFDVWVNRTLVYSLLTAVIVVVYAVLTSLGGLFWTGDDATGALIITVLLAVCFHPARVRVQRAVDRFVYGQRLDPKFLLAELRASRDRILVAREDERRRLQRDLHDGLGPTLASLYQRIDAARSMVDTDPGGAEQLLSDVGQVTRGVIGDIRDLVRDLRPPELEELGLANALAEAVHRFEGIDVLVETSLDGSVPPTVETAAYRIVMEALTNVVRHASASTAQVRLDLRDAGLVLTIADDGIGMSRGHRIGTGLRSMRERADELGGTFAIDTSSIGTTVRAVLPLGVGS